MREDTVDIEDDDAIAMDGNHTENAAPRSIGLLSSINLVLGQIVGSGVFASPGIVLNLLQGHYISSLITWLLGGLITIAGGLVYAELGSTFQHSGGDHTYIHMAFGSLPSFLYDWTVVLLGRPGGVAVDAVVFGEYVVRMVGYRGEESDRELAEVLKRLSAIACVVLLTAVNAVSGKWGTTVGDVSTILKMIALFSIGITAPYFYFHPLTPLPPSPPLPTDPRVFALSLYSVLFAYDGFNNLNNVAGEVKDPSRTFPRAVVIACSLVTASYVLANVAYLGVIGVDGVRGSVAVVVDFGVRLFGPAVGHLFPVIVLVATLGACNATIFTACRTLAKVAHDGNAPSYFAVIDGRTGVPFRALIFQAVVSSALILIGSYEELVNLLAPTGWLSYATTTLSLLRFRYTHPDVTRPYRVPTVIAIMFLATAVSLVVTGVAGAPREGLASLGVLVLGSVVWWIGVRNGGDVRGGLRNLITLASALKSPSIKGVSSMSHSA
ncbi:amino acid transporter [Gonapodya prolifera JEL478]|uniref:Amino acid transporter n=1 Tax=Gonapodya prolifera (strain JEL478) TaxID=1344416 RepID=A0A139AM74_GONPJ|nr:amino acid transporter [Gonapodya prolifera JEL478]|eukprot:KXS17870.1 amino acid transporter [Gonapodya prolifera JEL478]